MKNPFKRERETVADFVYSGKVKFILDGSIKYGVIFGKPFYEGSMTILGPRTYHIKCGDKVYDIPSHAIEELK